MIARRFERYEVLSTVAWDFFSFGVGSKSGVITNVSRGGCLLHASELIEHRRWLRILAAGRGNLHLSLVGRVTRCENVIAVCANQVTLYRYGIEFARPGEDRCELPEEPMAAFAPKPDNVEYPMSAPKRHAGGRLSALE